MDELNKQRRRFISINDSACLYGIAILLMVFHHCFCIPSCLGENYISVLGDYALEARIAWIGKLCVAIFAFISGYAFSIKAEKNKEEHVINRMLSDYKLSISHLIKFYSKFWLVFLIFIPIGIAFFGKSGNPKNLAQGLILGWGGYCGEWWYIAQYIKFLLVFPILDTCVSVVCNYQNPRRAIMLVGAVSFAAIAVLIIRIAFWDSFAGKGVRYLVNSLWSDYFLIFASAFIIGRFRIYEKIACKVIFPTTVYLIALFAVILIRWICVTGPAQSNYDPLLTPMLVLSLVGLLHKMKSENPIVRFLRYLGKYSTFIWLTHTFWIYYYFQPIVLAAKYSALIFIWAMMISLVNAILLNKLYELIEKFMQLRLYRRKII